MEHERVGVAVDRSVEDVHGVRLMALLRELVRERDVKGAAEELGVDARTLTTSMRRGRLSDRMRVALEQRLLGLERSAREQAGRTEALEKRVGSLEEEREASPDVLERAGAAIEGTVAALREKHAKAMRRLARVEAALQTGSVAAVRAEGDRPRRTRTGGRTPRW